MTKNICTCSKDDIPSSVGVRVQVVVTKELQNFSEAEAFPVPC